MAQARGRNPLRSMMNDGPVRRRGRLAFIGEVWTELTRVTWPSREDAMRLTGLVLGVSAAVGAFLALWDLGFSELVERVFL
ncbi:MAG: preprotein translocase subunit SecE [Chloroflexota bacterium]|nr:preprotein translocase subunit SecE [Chloroflexota bacterium]MDE2885613.1 preprotein translocase subunit SecE [Chloroflexota bacterium]